MTTYKEVKGTNIEAVVSDPSNPVEGQIWFNTATGLAKGTFNDPGSWATGGALNTARTELAGSGTQTAGLAFGGTNPDTNKTEAYGGTTWTEVNNLNTARANLAGAGTQTSALAFGGTPPGVLAITELWNGTN